MDSSNRDVFEEMIELQIRQFNEVARLQKELGELQKAYREQCVANANLARENAQVREYVQSEQYLLRGDVTRILGIKEVKQTEQEEAEAMLDELSAEAERIEVEEAGK